MLAATKPVGPAWTPVLGAEVLFAPIHRPMLLRARRAARAASQEGEAEGAVTLSAIDMLDEIGDAMSRALIVEGVKGWRDVGLQLFDEAGAPILDKDGAATFEALPFSAENLAIVLSDPVSFEAFDAAYVIPFVMRERERAAPGNGFAASPSGIGEAATLGSATANSRVAQRKAGAAVSARTSRTSRKAKPKKTSGAS